MQSKKGAMKRFHGSFGVEWLCSHVTCSNAAAQCNENYWFGAKAWGAGTLCPPVSKMWGGLRHVLSKNWWCLPTTGLRELPIQREPAAASGSQPAAVKPLLLLLFIILLLIKKYNCRAKRQHVLHLCWAATVWDVSRMLQGLSIK